MSPDVHLQSDTNLHRLSLQGALSIAYISVSDQHWAPCREHFAAGLLCPGSVLLNQPNISQEEKISISTPSLDRDSAPLIALGFSDTTN